MSRSIGLTPEIIAYLEGVNPPEHPVLSRCREETQRLSNSAMQISSEQADFMRLMARLVNARRAFEVGVFTGYSSLAVALEMQALHADARLLACDVSEDYTSKARGYWREAGVENVIQLELRPATETLAARLKAGEGGQYDFGFIDADKTGYDGYYEAGLKLLRVGGLMLFDNMLWGGAVADPKDTSEDTVALRALAAKMRGDARVHAVTVAIGDGITLCIKK